jgi:hypothetical protein
VSWCIEVRESVSYVGSPVLKFAPWHTISSAVWLTMMAPNEANGHGPLWLYNASLVFEHVGLDMLKIG